MTSPPILVVEDDEGIRAALRLLLEFYGYEVAAAANGKEALVLLSSIPRPCLILLDLMMPVMDGWAFAHEVERDGALAAIPIVILTAFPDRDTPGNAVAVVAKPVDVDRLMAVVARLAGARA